MSAKADARSPFDPEIERADGAGEAMTAAAHATFTIVRRFEFPLDEVFAAWSRADAKRRWFADGEGFETGSYSLDFRVSGKETGRFRSSAHPALFSNETVYLDIVDNARIVFAYTMAADGRIFSASLATVELAAEEKGTRVSFTEQGAFFENADGPKMRKQGWENLLAALKTYLGGEKR
jgi:uncharacterized protein YndB with AHSA1/START domain